MEGGKSSSGPVPFHTHRTRVMMHFFIAGALPGMGTTNFFRQDGLTAALPNYAPPMVSAGRVVGMRARVVTAGAVNNTQIIGPALNGTEQAMSPNLRGTESATVDTTNGFNFVAGDRISMRIRTVGGGAQAAANLSVTLELLLESVSPFITA